MNSFIGRGVLSFFLLSVWVAGSSAWAQDRLLSEFFFVVEKDHLNSFNQRGQNHWSGSINEQLSDMVFEEPYSTKVRQIKLKLNFSLMTEQPVVRPGLYPFKAAISDFGLAIGSVTTKDKIKKRFGNLVVDVNVEGQCNNLNLKLSTRENLIQGFVQAVSMNGKIELKVIDVQVELDPKTISVATANCRGPSGYAAVVKNKITEYASDLDTVKKWVLRGIESRLTGVETEINSQILRRQTIKLSDGVVVDLYPEQVQLNEFGDAEVYGVLAINFVGSQLKTYRYVGFDRFQRRNHSHSALVLPVGFADVALQAFYNNGLLSHHIRAQEEPSLRELFRSRWSQWFVWPDLANFPKSSDFLFDVFALTKPTLKSVDAMNGQLNLLLTARVATAVLRPTEGRYESAPRYSDDSFGFSPWSSVNPPVVNNSSLNQGPHAPYVYFDTLTDAKFTVELSADKVRVKMSSAKLKSSHRWDQEYVDVFDPNTYVDVDTLDEKLAEALTSRFLEFSLEPIDIGISGQLVPSHFEQGSGGLEVIFTN